MRRRWRDHYEQTAGRIPSRRSADPRSKRIREHAPPSFRPQSRCVPPDVPRVPRWSPRAAGSPGVTRGTTKPLRLFDGSTCGTYRRMRGSSSRQLFCNCRRPVCGKMDHAPPRFRGRQIKSAAMSYSIVFRLRGTRRVTAEASSATAALKLILDLQASEEQIVSVLAPNGRVVSVGELESLADEEKHDSSQS